LFTWAKKPAIYPIYISHLSGREVIFYKRKALKNPLAFLCQHVVLVFVLGGDADLLEDSQMKDEFGVVLEFQFSV
jgi:hypothetical protein